jgi:hypothetical protein
MSSDGFFRLNQFIPKNLFKCNSKDLILFLFNVNGLKKMFQFYLIIVGKNDTILNL